MADVPFKDVPQSIIDEIDKICRPNDGIYEKWKEVEKAASLESDGELTEYTKHLKPKIVNPIAGFNDEELAHYVSSLVSQVETRLELKDYSACAWRLADALGALTALCPEGAQGLDKFTGLGYRLDVRDNDDT